MCNPGFRGPACTEQYCPYDCYEHGDCVNGQCHCRKGWTGQFCSIADRGPNETNPEVHGEIEFVEQSYSTTEAAQRVDVVLTRRQGTHGTVTAIIDTQDITAEAWKDYISIKGHRVTWADGSNAPINVTITVLQDNLPEDTETFKVVISNVTGGAVAGRRNHAVISIAANDQTQPAKEVVEVTVRVNVDLSSLPEGSIERRDFEAMFLGDVARALDADVARFAPRFMKADGDGSLFIFFILEGSPAPSALASRLLRMFADPESRIYDPNYSRVSSTSDISFEPVVYSAEDPRRNKRSGLSSGALAGIIVGSIVAALAVIGALGYWKRRTLSEWVLWRAGRMRFTPFTQHVDDHDGLSDEDANASLGSGDQDHHDSDGALLPHFDYDQGVEVEMSGLDDQ